MTTNYYFGLFKSEKRFSLKANYLIIDKVDNISEYRLNYVLFFRQTLKSRITLGAEQLDLNIRLARTVAVSTKYGWIKYQTKI